MSSKKKFYAGIGARESPPDIIETMRKIAHQLGVKGYTLRSGGACGADTAFYNGASICGFPALVYLPSSWFNRNVHNPSKGFLDATTTENWIKALEIVDEFHPTAQNLSKFVKQLMARNVYQILSTSLDTPVDFVVCWTPRGKHVGGTGFALRVAGAYNVPIYNLALVEDVKKFHSEVLNNVVI